MQCSLNFTLGSLFQQHVVYGLDTLIKLAHGAVISGDTPLLADLLALLVRQNASYKRLSMKKENCTGSKKTCFA
jgi:hypothetical protein